MYISCTLFYTYNYIRSLHCMTSHDMTLYYMTLRMYLCVCVYKYTHTRLFICNCTCMLQYSLAGMYVLIIPNFVPGCVQARRLPCPASRYFKVQGAARGPQVVSQAGL